ncbi:hypothetical protein [Dyadobacter crusticola]|uniref:hypothetical protein n=1 Tax=Dyadobacter crusticola TaxID=292407 RepID=UPI000AB71667|nr:hypothetical protein [Dyadobacter crusticola]
MINPYRGVALITRKIREFTNLAKNSNFAITIGELSALLKKGYEPAAVLNN